MADNSQSDTVAERELSAGPTQDASSTALPLRRAVGYIYLTSNLAHSTDNSPV
jgi:hypothetical protein